ncbi:MAG: hypothetical protein IJE43_19150 [Alphaproteobacteria bacterium]|nr:hypothetical protein [Alphaproteobacteria bacterium]
MFLYDEKRNELVICKVPIEEPDYKYKECDMYKSYMKYVEKGIIEDVRDKLIPALSESLENSGEHEVHVKDYEVILDRYSTYRGYEYYTLLVNFGGIGIGQDMAKFPIFKIPYMDKFGVIYREGKTYALISELSQDSDITFGDDELKIVTKGGCYINIKSPSKVSNSLVTKFNKRNLKSTDILFGLADQEGLDGSALFNKLKSSELIGLFKDEAQLFLAADGGWASAYNTAFLGALQMDKYDVSTVRTRLNDVFSIDKALGETLFDDVELKDGSIIECGTIVTENILRILKKNYINEIYVKHIPNMVGKYLSRNVRLPILRRGTEIIPALEGKLPEGEDGMFVSKDYIFDNEEDYIILEMGSIVTEGMLEALAYNGHSDVWLKSSEDTEKEELVPLSISIVGNRHFKKRDIGLGVSDEYVYVTEEGEILPASNRFQAYDMLAMISLYDRLRKGLDYNLVADKDLGLRKKVNQAEELFHKAFDGVVKDYVRYIRNKFIKTYKNNKSKFFSPDEMEAMFYKLSELWWRQLYKMKVVNMIDKMNPLSYYASFNKVNTIIADKNAIKRSQHSLSMGHFNRICPYETPSGKTMGVVSYKVPECTIENGKMFTPYFRVKHVGSRTFLDSTRTYMTVLEEEKHRIGSITSLEVDWNTREVLTKGRVLARVPSRNKLEKMTVANIDIEYLEYVNCDPQQTCSMTARSIPYAGGNDSARVIFGLSMAKQAKGEVDGQKPGVVTSAFYDVLLTSDFYSLHAEKDGEVLEVANNYITVLYDADGTEETDDYEERLGIYEFDPVDFSTNAVVIRTVNVEEGQRVKAGDILVRSNYTKDDCMVNGRNALVGYAPMGYNYEDGVYVSQRFGLDSMSFGCKTEKTKVPKAFKSIRITDINKYQYLSKHDKIFSIKYGKGDDEHNHNVYADHAKGFIIKCGAEDTNRDGTTTIVTQTVSLDYMMQGDKIANRHGNKGVTPIICKNEDMPSFKNGEFLDIVNNPTGLPSRMNFGGALEIHSGFVWYITGIHIRSDSFNGASIEDIELLLSLVWHLANTDDWDSIFAQERFKVLPEGYINKLKQNKRSIRNWEGCFNEDGTAEMINPMTGTYFETPILVGVNYYYKLYHEVLNKEHVRAGYCTEPYVEKLDSPPKGSSKDGGQREGYMEFDALMQYGAVEMLHEFQNERGDNGVARNNFTVNYLHAGDTTYLLDESTGIRRSTEYFVAMMQSQGITIDFEGVLPNKTPEEYGRRIKYKPQTLANALLSDETKEVMKDKSFVASKSEFEDIIK